MNVYDLAAKINALWHYSFGGSYRCREDWCRRCLYRTVTDYQKSEGQLWRVEHVLLNQIGHSGTGWCQRKSLADAVGEMEHFQSWRSSMNVVSYSQIAANIFCPCGELTAVWRHRESLLFTAHGYKYHRREV